MNKCVDATGDQATAEAIKSIDAQLASAAAVMPAETILLLKIAKLSLQLKLHRISDGEFRAFCDALRGLPDQSVRRWPVGRPAGLMSCVDSKVVQGRDNPPTRVLGGKIGRNRARVATARPDTSRRRIRPKS